MEAEDERFEQAKQQICNLYDDGVSMKEAVKLMRYRDVSASLVKDIYKELSVNSKISMTDKFYYSTNMEYDWSCRFKFLTSRFLLAYGNESLDSDFHEITLFDVFHDKSTKVTVKKLTSVLTNIYPLKDGFGLLEEEEDIYTLFISLVFLNLHDHTLKKLHTIECPSNRIQIIVNKADSTTFLLKGPNNDTRICKVVEKQIINEEIIEMNFRSHYFYDKFVYGLNWYVSGEDSKQKPRLDIYNVEQKTENHIDLDDSMINRIHRTHFECVRGNLFVVLERENETSVIGCFNLQTHQWSILDFMSKLPIRGINWFEKGNLIVYALPRYVETHHFYKISLGNPESLENTAWFSLVKTMRKRDKIKDPYEAARKYLPPNSSINCPFEWNY